MDLNRSYVRPQVWLGWERIDQYVLIYLNAYSLDLLCCTKDFPCHITLRTRTHLRFGVGQLLRSFQECGISQKAFNQSDKSLCEDTHELRKQHLRTLGVRKTPGPALRPEVSSRAVRLNISLLHQCYQGHESFGLRGAMSGQLRELTRITLRSLKKSEAPTQNTGVP